MRTYLVGFAQWCQASQLFSSLFAVRVCEDILADEIAVHEKALALSHQAETAECEVDKIISEVLQAEEITADEKRALRRALKITQSAERINHDLGDLVALT